MNQDHVLTLISDYTLDLLGPGERLQVEAHTAACAVCRQALQREKQMALSISHTLHLATQPANGRLQALMPAPPRPAARRSAGALPRLKINTAAWTAQLAPMMVVLVLLAGSLWLYLTSPDDPWNNNAPGYFVITETATATATATSSATSLPSTSLPTASPVATIADIPDVQTPQTSAISTTSTSQTAATPVAEVAQMERLGD